jgi:hypothetical protein
MSAPTPPRLLRDLLAQARDELKQRQPDSAFDAAVLARLHRMQQVLPDSTLALQGGSGRQLQRAARGGLWLIGALLLLATALLLIEPPRLAERPGAAMPAALRADSGFMPVVSAAEWQRAMAGLQSEGQAAVWLMPTELPRERLALLGLPYDAARADEHVRAELMLHPNGQLLAVRFLQ